MISVVPTVSVPSPIAYAQVLASGVSARSDSNGARRPICAARPLNSLKLEKGGISPAELALDVLGTAISAGDHRVFISYRQSAGQ